MTPLNVALFAPYLPAPGHSGGRIRILQLSRALARFADISLFASAAPADQRRFGRSPELAVFRSVTLGHDPFALLGFGRPERVRRALPRGLARAFLAAHTERRFDAVVVEHSHAAAVALGAGVPWLLDEHNVESLYVEQRLLATGGANTFFARRKLAALRRWEEQAWQRADCVVCVSEADAERIRAVRARPTLLVPNGVDTQVVEFRPPSARAGQDIVFVGLMGHPPNASAARWLHGHVLPLVWAEEPHARLTLCGADPPRDLQAAAGPNVDVTGRVDSVLPYLQRAAVYANPLREGAGTSLKVLEALASGLPLVSTECGVRGFPLGAPRDYLAAEDAATFAAQLLVCLRAPAERDEAAHRGRALAEGQDWSSLGARFAEAVRAVALRR